MKNSPNFQGSRWRSGREELAAYWDDINLLEKSISTRANRRPFVFYEGPPQPMVAPASTTSFPEPSRIPSAADKTMEGYMVKRKASWDTHGLPVEIEVEKTAEADQQSRTSSVTASRPLTKSAGSLFLPMERPGGIGIPQDGLSSRPSRIPTSPWTTTRSKRCGGCWTSSLRQGLM